MKRLSLLAVVYLCITAGARSQVHYVSSDINTVGAQGSVIESASASPLNGPEVNQWFTGIN